MHHGGAVGLGAGELFKALDDHVAIQGIDLHQQGTPRRLLGRDERRAAAAKEVQDILTGQRGVLDGAGRQLHGFFGEMDHALRINLFNTPQIRGIAGPVILVCGAFAPTIETPLVGTHVVFAG